MLLLALLLVFFLEYMRPDQFFPFILSLNLYALVPLVVFFVAAIANTRNSNEVILRTRISKLLLALLLMATVSIITALDKSRAWEVWQGLLGYILLFFMVAKVCDTKDRLKWLFRTIIALHIALIFQNPALITDPTQRTYIRNVTFLGDGNDFALSVVIVLPMCLYLYQSARGATARMLYAVSGLLLFGAILGTQSRGATIAIMVMVFYLWTLSQKKGKAAIWIGIGLIIVLAVASDTYLSRVQSITNYAEDGSATARLRAWGAGVEMALRRPLAGIGIGNFPRAFAAFGYSVPGIRVMNAHSMYINALAEMAWIGIAILLSLLWHLFRQNHLAIKSVAPEAAMEKLDNRKLLISTTVSLVGFAVAAAFVSVLYYPHLYVMSGIILAARRIASCDDQEGNSRPARFGWQSESAVQWRSQRRSRLRGQLHRII